MGVVIAALEDSCQLDLFATLGAGEVSGKWPSDSQSGRGRARRCPLGDLRAVLGEPLVALWAIEMRPHRRAHQDPPQRVLRLNFKSAMRSLTTRAGPVKPTPDSKV